MSGPIQGVDLPAVVWRRRSTRAFRGEPLPDKILHAALEAMRWAPSAYNAQPWAVVIARRDREPQAYAALLASLRPSNARWAASAPVLLLVAVYPLAPSGEVNRHAWFDVGGAWAWFTMAAVEHGAAVHPMAGFDPSAAAAAVELPAPWEVAIVAAVGYPDDPARLPEDLRARELGPQRTRKGLGDFAFAGRWGESLTLAEPVNAGDAPRTPPATASP